jgi:ParB/RepB/Spo0J family partition protein
MRGEKIMPSTQNAVNNHEYRSVPIAALAESATNPRKRFDAKSLEELAASFKTQGILAPLLVRELEESKYEVVAGARRLRAAKLAELEKLPVRVVKLTDAEAIEAQCVENLQREDIHPLEEALGFKSLLELGEPAYSIATIASRAGKSEAYVYGRIRLADLIPPVAEAFLKDQITIGQALFANTSSGIDPNVITISIQPDEGISIAFDAKRPGTQVRTVTVQANFSYQASFGSKGPVAYETLLLDSMRGDATLFTRRDEVEAEWRIITPIEEAWTQLPALEFPNYAAGSEPTSWH